jgi:nickel-dependent lactate racemase
MAQHRKRIAIKTSLHFGGKDVSVSIQAPCEILRNKGFTTEGEDKIFNMAFSSPVGSETFSECSKKAKSVLIIVTDATRPTPTSKVLEHLYPHIFKHPDVKFIVATGSHRAPTEKEFESMFGKFYKDFKSRIFVHDSKKDSEMVHVGKTSRGTEVSFNKMVLAADLLVPINSVEPHYFAGFTGGRKSFLPGVAAFRTIEMNHSHAIEPGAQPLRIKGNPVAEDMDEALEFIIHKKIFGIQTVMSDDNRLIAAFTGDIRGSFEAAIKSALGLYSVPLSKKGNIVVTVAAPPMDINLYQAQKALEHGWPALEKGGIMILVSKCWDGIGEPAFF